MGEREVLLNIAKKERGVNMALQVLKSLSKDEKMRMIAISEEKRLTDYQIDLNTEKDFSFRKGLEEGRRSGLEEGLARGHQSGLEEGRKSGLEEGLARGRKAELEEMIRKMRKSGLSEEMIKSILEKD